MWPYSQHIGWPQPLPLPSPERERENLLLYLLLLTRLVAGAFCTRAVMTRTSSTPNLFTAHTTVEYRVVVTCCTFRRVSMQNAACRRRHRHTSSALISTFADLLHVMTGDVIGFETWTVVEKWDSRLHCIALGGAMAMGLLCTKSSKRLAWLAWMECYKLLTNRRGSPSRTNIFLLCCIS